MVVASVEVVTVVATVEVAVVEATAAADRNYTVGSVPTV
jgi:hypothetical protein